VQSELIIALIIAMPIALLMAAFICYLNIEGFYTIVISRLRKKPAIQKKTVKEHFQTS
jgi:hypothetical protein